MNRVETFFIKIIFKENIKKEIYYLKHLGENFPNTVEKLNKNCMLIKNNGIGLFLISKLIDRYHPFIWIYSMEEFMEFQIPKEVKEAIKCRKNLTEDLKKELMNIKY